MARLRVAAREQVFVVERMAVCTGAACKPIGPRSGLVVVVGIIGDAISKLTLCLPKRTRQLGELCSAEEYEQDHEDDDQFTGSEASHVESVAGTENKDPAVAMTHSIDVLVPWVPVALGSSSGEARRTAQSS